MKKIHYLIPVLAFLVGSLFSCKKQKGVLDDFPPGRFDFICIWNKGGVQDTVIGEVSGPYLQSMEYYFRVRKELGGVSSLRTFKTGKYSGMTDSFFYASGIFIESKITYEEHDTDHLAIYFQYNELIGSFILTRKQ